MAREQPYLKIHDLESADGTSSVAKGRSSSRMIALPAPEVSPRGYIVPMILMGSILLWVLLLFTASPPVLLGAEQPSPRACSFLECKRSMCDARFSPYVCVTGASIRGCASTPSYWEISSDCSDWCDMSRCAVTTPSPADEEDLNALETCPQCTTEQCGIFLATCNYNEWFVCLEGGAQYGCADDMYYWPPAMSGGVCTLCCNGEACHPALPMI